MIPRPLAATAAVATLVMACQAPVVIADEDFTPSTQAQVPTEI